MAEMHATLSLFMEKGPQVNRLNFPLLAIREEESSSSLMSISDRVSS
jgi:hypothetical protein